MAATAFGTMAEDGSSKFITSLTTVGDTFNDVNDAAQNMFDNSTTDSQTLESNMRKLQDALIPLGDMLTQLANEVLPPIVKAVKAFAEWFAKLPAPVQNFTVILGILLARLRALTPIIAPRCCLYQRSDSPFCQSSASLQVQRQSLRELLKSLKTGARYRNG